MSECVGYNVWHYGVSQDSIILHINVFLSVIMGLLCLDVWGTLSVTMGLVRTAYIIHVHVLLSVIVGLKCLNVRGTMSGIMGLVRTA